VLIPDLKLVDLEQLSLAHCRDLFPGRLSLVAGCRWSRTEGVEFDYDRSICDDACLFECLIFVLHQGFVLVVQQQSIVVLGALSLVKPQDSLLPEISDLALVVDLEALDLVEVPVHDQVDTDYRWVWHILDY